MSNVKAVHRVYNKDTDTISLHIEGYDKSVKVIPDLTIQDLYKFLHKVGTAIDIMEGD